MKRLKFVTDYLFCSPKLLRNVDELDEIFCCLDRVKWTEEFSLEVDGHRYEHQAAYNKALEIEFSSFGWELQPMLYHDPRLIGDFMKNDIFVEVQFGNSSTIYRDYYKFHYGLTHNLLSLAVLILPTTAKNFFPTRRSSVSNMAEFEMAKKYYRLLPIPVPILLIGLLPEN